jgi:hypothetical protein
VAVGRINGARIKWRWLLRESVWCVLDGVRAPYSTLRRVIVGAMSESLAVWEKKHGQRSNHSTETWLAHSAWEQTG